MTANSRTARDIGRSARADCSVIWSPDYLKYRWGDSHPMNPTRLDLTMSLAKTLGILDGVELLRPDPATDEELLRIHTRPYVEAVKLAPQVGSGSSDSMAATIGHGLGTDDNPVFEGMHEAGAIITGGTLAAARQIAGGTIRRAVSLGGGMHHAMANAASGFCVYNDCAVAISWLLDNGFDRIAYIDIDVHHGDGVQHAFYSDPRVLTVSVHQHPATLWPNTGWPAEVGEGEAAGTSVNLALLPGTPDAMWLRAFHAVVPGAVRAFRPQILISQCGVDSHREDPLADLSLTVDGHRAAFRAIGALAEEFAEGRWLAVGGGGYGLIRVVPRSWTYLLAAMLDREIPATTAIPPQWRDLAATVAPGTQIPLVMGDGGDTSYRHWDGPGAGVVTGAPSIDRDLARVDSAIGDTRGSVFPLLGLDPDDPRD